MSCIVAPQQAAAMGEPQQAVAMGDWRSAAAGCGYGGAAALGSRRESQQAATVL